MVPQMKEAVIMPEVEEAFDRLISNCDSLLSQLDNNIVEKCHSVIAKFVGGKRINWGMKGAYLGRCCAAVVQNNSQRVLSEIVQISSKYPSKIVTKMEDCRILKNKFKKINADLTKMFTEKTENLEETAEIKQKSHKRNHYGKTCNKLDLPPDEYERKKEELFKKLKGYQTERHNVEIRTRSNPKNDKWFYLRRL